MCVCYTPACITANHFAFIILHFAFIMRADFFGYFLVRRQESNMIFSPHPSRLRRATFPLRGRFRACCSILQHALVLILQLFPVPADGSYLR